MSKASRSKTRKRRNRNCKKKNKTSFCTKNEESKRQLRFVAYMLEGDARDFSGVLCSMQVDTIIKVKYKTVYFDKVAYTRISLYVSNQYLCKAYDLLEGSPLRAVGSKQFYSPKCRAFASVLIEDENLCMIGQISHEALNFFKGDAKDSNALSNAEILSYKVSEIGPHIIIEIYADKFWHEYIVHVLQEGWMSEQWKNQFQIVDLV